MNTRLSALLIITITLSLFTACGATTEEETTPTPEASEQILPVSLYIPADAEVTPEYGITGVVDSQIDTTITAAESGILDVLLVQPGDVVVAGQTIGQLSTEGSSNTIDEQLQNLYVTRNNLQQSYTLQKSVLDEGIVLQQTAVRNAELQLQRSREQVQEATIQANQDIKNAETALANAKASVNLSSNVAESNVAQAQESLGNTKETANKNIQDAISRAELTNKQVATQLENIVTTTNSILGEDYPYRGNNNRFRSYLGVLSPQTQNDVRFQYIILRDAFAEHTANKAKRSVEENLNSLLTIADKAVEVVDTLDYALEMSSTGPSFTQQDLTALRNTVDALQLGQSSVYTLSSQIETSVQQLENVQITSRQSIEQATIALETAKRNLQNASQQGSISETPIAVQNAESQLASTKIRATQQISAAEQGVRLATIQLDQATNQLRQAEVNNTAQLQGLQSQIDDLRGQIAILTDRSSNLLITTPVGGTITEVAVTEGASISGGTMIAKVQDTNQKKVIVQIPEEMVPHLDINTLHVEEEMLTLLSKQPSLNPTNQKRTFEYLLPQGSEETIGSIIRGTITIASTEGTLIPIPLTYNENRKLHIFVAEGDIATQITLEDTTLIDEYILVDSSQVPASTAIIATKSPFLTNKTKISYE